MTLQTAGLPASDVKSLTEVLRTDLQSLRNDEKFNEVLQRSENMSSDSITKTMKVTAEHQFFHRNLTLLVLYSRSIWPPPSNMSIPKNTLSPHITRRLIW